MVECFFFVCVWFGFIVLLRTVFRWSIICFWAHKLTWDDVSCQSCTSNRMLLIFYFAQLKSGDFICRIMTVFHIYGVYYIILYLKCARCAEPRNTVCMLCANYSVCDWRYQNTNTKANTIIIIGSRLNWNYVRARARDSIALSLKLILCNSKTQKQLL